MNTSTNAKGIAPHLSLLASEPVKALLDLAGLVRAEVMPCADDLKAAPRGNGEPLLVLPGLATADSSTAVLRRHLNLRGYSAHPWKRGLNRGPHETSVEQWLGRLGQEPSVPTASIYSERDGVVHPSACIQPDPRQTLHVPLKSCGHFGLVLSTEAIRAVLHTLPELLQLNNVSRPPSSRKHQ